MSAPPKRKTRPRAPTLSDVGRAAGVSAMAASAVLNGARTSSRISDQTRRKILEAASQLNYRPNAAARALANRRMNTIGVAAVFSGAAMNPYFLEVFNGIVETAAVQLQTTTVFPLRSWDQDAERIGGFCDGRIDGLILIAPLISPAAAAGLPNHVPFVALHANTPMANVINLECDEETGAYELVRNLTLLGHRRIMHVAGPPSAVGAQRRLRGYRRALKEAGIEWDPTLVVVGNYVEDFAREALHTWLRRHQGQPLPQAVFAANDGTAIGCMEVLAQIGVRVPDDVSVVGFDDTLAARTTVPQLTTVRQPLRDMGQKAVELLLQEIAVRHAPSTTPPPPVVFSTSVILRASLGPPPLSPRLTPTLRSPTLLRARS